MGCVQGNNSTVNFAPLRGGNPYSLLGKTSWKSRTTGTLDNLSSYALLGHTGNIYFARLGIVLHTFSHIDYIVDYSLPYFLVRPSTFSSYY